MRIFSRVLLLILALLGLILAVVLYYTVNPRLPDYVPVEQVRYQDQWSAADRQTYYFTPQGTQVKGLHYDWFTALELPFSEQRFAAPDQALPMSAARSTAARMRARHLSQSGCRVLGSPDQSHGWDVRRTRYRLCA